MGTCIRKLLVLLLLPASLWATTTVTGTLQNLGTGMVGQGAFVRFWLRGCAGGIPRVGGTAVIAPSQGGVYFFDFAANSSGVISGTLYSTRNNAGTGAGDIDCNGSKTSVWYGMQIFVGGKGGSEIPIHAKSGSPIDISTVVPITTNPVIAAPTGDATYLRLDNGNGPATNEATLSGSNAFTGPEAHSGTETFTGPLNAGTFNAVQIAGVGANTTLQATINAAMAAAPGSAGCPEVWVPPGYAETITSQITVGSSTKCVTLTVSRAALLTFNTNLANDAIAVFKNSSIVSDGINIGGPGSQANIVVGASGVYTSIVASYPRASAEWVGYIRGLTIAINPAASITSSVFSFNDITSSSRVQENTISGGGAGGVLHEFLFTSDSGGTIGPVSVDNNYANAVVTAAPVLIQQTAGTIANLNFSSGTYNHPPTGFSAIECQGTSAGPTLQELNFWGVYTEQNANTTNAYLLNNCSNVNISGAFLGAISPMTTGGIGVKISKSFTGGAGGIQVNNLLNLGGALVPTTISDTTQSPPVNNTDARIIHWSLLPYAASAPDFGFATYVNGDNANHGLAFQVIQSGANGGAGLQAPMFRTASANPAVSGPVRLSHSDYFSMRNNANTDDNGLQTDASDNLRYFTKVTGGGGISFLIPAVNDQAVGRATSDQLTNKTLNVPFPSGTGLQLFNTTTTCTTGASVGAICTTGAITLPVAEADTAYRVVCTGKGVTNVPVVIAATNSSATQFTITIAALTAAAASFTSYDCTVGHN